MLKHTGTKLQLVDDPDLYLMVGSGNWGEVSTITKTHAVAYNPLVQYFDAREPTNYLMYLDANNLSG